MFKARSILALSLSLLAGTAQSAHFGAAFVDVRLMPPDSIRVTIEADAQDMMNTVYTFPYFADTGASAYRLYEQRMEAYLQQKVHLKADGKRVYLAAVAWKPDGKGRQDGLDSVSIQTGNHSITLGGKWPVDAKVLTIQTDLWNNRPEVTSPPSLEYSFYEKQVPLRRLWSITEKPVRFPVLKDSLRMMRKHPPGPGAPRAPDHRGHNHGEE